MEKTAPHLSALRERWAEMNYPNVSEIAKKANVARQTAHRYLTGATKGGTPEIVRALAIAMDRRDIADSIPYTGFSKIAHTDDYLAELAQQWEEKTLQLLSESDIRHKNELEEMTRTHHAEREDWNIQRKALHEEAANLRAAFDKAVSFRDAQLKHQQREKHILFVLFLAAVVLLVVK